MNTSRTHAGTADEIFNMSATAFYATNISAVNPALNTTLEGSSTVTTVSEMFTSRSAPRTLSGTIDAVRFYSSVLATLFICLGICGNVLSILVWKQKKMRSSTGVYLIGQAIADMCLLVFFFLVESLPALAPEVTVSRDYGIFYAYFGYPFFYYFLVCSIWFTVGVTIDRFIQVRWPLQAKVCNGPSA